MCFHPLLRRVRAQWNMGKRSRPLQRAHLPQCVSGDVPGRWMFHHSIYPDFPGAPTREPPTHPPAVQLTCSVPAELNWRQNAPVLRLRSNPLTDSFSPATSTLVPPGEPLVWRPYNCHYEHVTGSQLKDCLKRIGKTMTLGESTLEQIHDVMQLHMNMSSYYWPSKIIEPNPRAMKGQYAAELHGTEQHGMSVMLEGGLAELRTVNPNVLIVLQGANDPARDTLANFEMRFKEFVGKVKAWREEGVLKFTKIIMIGAPTRQNKARSHHSGATEQSRAECDHLDAPRAWVGGCDQMRIAAARTNSAAWYKSAPHHSPLLPSFLPLLPSIAQQGGYAGQTVCPDGERETCVVTPSSAFVMPNAQVGEGTVPSLPAASEPAALGPFYSAPPKPPRVTTS